MEKIELEKDIYRYQKYLYFHLLHCYQECVMVILKTKYETTKEIETLLTQLDNDFKKIKKVINTLTLEKIDILEQEFKNEDSHIIVFLYENGWKVFKSFFKNYKELIINGELSYGRN